LGGPPPPGGAPPPVEPPPPGGPPPAALPAMSSSSQGVPDAGESGQSSSAWARLSAEGRHSRRSRRMSTEATRADPQALHLALIEGEDSRAAQLIELGTDLNARPGFDRFSALHMAARHGRTEVLRLMLTCDAHNSNEVNGQSASDETPLFLSAQWGHVACVNLLIAARADTGAARSDGRSPIYVTVESDHLPCLRLLLRAKADATARRGKEQSPLHLAARHGRTDALHLMLNSRPAEARPDVLKQQAADGATPLLLSAVGTGGLSGADDRRWGGCLRAR